MMQSVPSPLPAPPQEMNQATPGRTLTQHRKAAVNFRDTALLRAFQVRRESAACDFTEACAHEKRTLESNS
jgi:hypothetical protein